MHNSPKRILHVFSSLELGGAQRRFIEYLHRSKAGYVHNVYAMDGNYTALELVKDLEAPDGGAQLVPKGNTLAAITACRRMLKKNRPDLLITYNWGAVEWAVANKFFSICPTIHIQDGFTEEEQSKELWARQMFRRFAYKGCEAVVVPSKTLEQKVQDDWHISENKLQFIPNGIDLERFQKTADESVLKSYGIDPAKRIIGTIAGLRPEKNVGRLIEAYCHIEDRIPNTQLVIIGDGVGMSALKMLAERVCTKDSVIFTGNISHPELVLPCFELFALSSDTEQMPISVIEAMAAGLPIVSTNVGDIAQMVSTENKPYVAGKDAQTLTNNISLLLETKKSSQEIGTANQNKAKINYAIDQMVHRYDTLFADCIN